MSQLSGTALPVDQDGLVVPELYANSPASWAKLAYPVRAKFSAKYLHKLAEAKIPKPAKTKRPGATRYTTDYAIAWGRKQGWTLIDRERYDARLKRHFDLEIGVDAIFDDGVDGRVGIQGAGKSERKEHWDRFIARGGSEKARRRNMRVFYVEFERGCKTPIKVEQWA